MDDGNETKKPPKITFMPCLTWVRQGKANEKLQKIKPSKDELIEIIKELKLKQVGYKVRPKREENASDDEDEDGRNVDDFYDMDGYDDEDGVEFPGLRDNIHFMVNNVQTDSEDSLDSDEEPDDFTVKPDDNLIVCGHVEDDMCTLQIYGFNNNKGEFFLLTDTTLPSYPICLEWLDYNPKNVDVPGHFAAVGFITPEISVWDLNVSGSLEPTFQLGSKKKTMRHTDGVMDLAWNKQNRNIIASGSADKTVILWDMSKTEGVTRIQSEEKVQSLKWHAFEAHSLLTGSCDGKARLYDCRNPKYFKTWAIGDGEIERVLWNDFDPFYFYATNEKGMVFYVDTRKSEPVWTLKAHDKEVTGISLSSHCKDLLMTASLDEAVKVWDLQGGTPTFVTQKNMNIGPIYTIASCPDAPYVFAASGSTNNNYLYVWDSRENDQVMARFKDRKFEDLTMTEQQEGAMDTSANISDPQPSTSQGTISRSNENIKLQKKRSESGKPVKSREKSKSKSKKKSHKDMHPKTPKGPDEN